MRMSRLALTVFLLAGPAMAQPSFSRPAPGAATSPGDIWSRPAPSAWDAAAPRPGQPVRRPPPVAWREDPDPPPLALRAAPLITFGVGVAVGRGVGRGRHCPW
jgi:hypothetical protein